MDDFRAASLQGWTAVAPDWGELTAAVDGQLGAAAEWMIEAAGLEPGERVLELAGGPGTVSLMAAQRVGAEGQVIHTDFSEAMVEVARRRIAAEGADNVECRVMDAEAIDMPGGDIDAVLCRMGYMLMADPAKALAETARVLAPGGRVALAVWSEASCNPWATVPMQAILGQLGAPPPPPGGPGLWALADEDRLARMIEDAGFQTPRIECVDDRVPYDSVEHMFEMTTRLAGPIRALMGNLDEAGRAGVVERMREAAKPYEQPDGTLSLPERMVVAFARRD